MRIDVHTQITLNNGVTMVLASRSEATPDLNSDLRTNAVEAIDRAVALVDEVKDDIFRQGQQWTDPRVSWPTLANPNQPIFRPPDGG